MLADLQLRKGAALGQCPKPEAVSEGGVRVTPESGLRGSPPQTSVFGTKSEQRMVLRDPDRCQGRGGDADPQPA